MGCSKLDTRTRVLLNRLDDELEHLYQQYDSAEWYSRETLTPDDDCHPIADRIFFLSLKQSAILENTQ